MQTARSKPLIELRPYQHAAMEAITRGFTDYQHQLAVKPTGCHAAGHPILMGDGSIKAVEAIAVGDQVMGPDSRSRTVLELHRGQDALFRITPNTGEVFTVNADHILHLRRTSTGKASEDSQPWACDISVSEYLGRSKNFKHLHKLERCAVEFTPRERKPWHIASYILGVAIGDGSLHKPNIAICTPDEEIVRELNRFAHCIDSDIRIESMPDNKASNYFFKGKLQRHGFEFFRYAVRRMGLDVRCEAKFVPEEYKIATRHERLELLAGLLDTDGHMTKGGFEYSTKSLRLAEDVLFVARSLGFAAYQSEKVVKGQPYQRIYISGDCSVIPVRIKRKQASARGQVKSVLVTGFSVERADEGNYFGFTLDGDQLYLDGSFTVHHNSGKTVLFSALAAHYQPKRTLVLAHREELIDQAVDKIMRTTGLEADVEMAESHASLHAPVVVASVQTLMREQRRSRWPRDHFGLIVVDECFPAGTLVDGRPIETISVGDRVSAFDHGLGVAVRRSVTRVFRRETGRICRLTLSNGRQIICTPCHPFWDGSTYVPAGQLTSQSVVYGITQSSNRALQTLRSSCGVQGQEAESLQPQCHAHRGRLLLAGMPGHGHPGDESQGDGDDQPAVCFGADEAQQPHAQSGHQGEDAHHAAFDAVDSACAGREWRAPVCGPNASSLDPGLGDGNGGAHEATASQRLSHLLQAGHREPGTHDCGGSGRQEPLLDRAAGAGPEEGGLAPVARVESIAFYERGSDPEFERLCPGGEVFNLEVEEDHNYFAEGVLVHNCHHTLADSYLGTLRYFDQNAFVLGVTATPDRSDKRTLAAYYENVAFEITLLDLIKEGYLSPITVKTVPLEIDLDGVRTVAGDYSADDLGHALEPYLEEIARIIAEEYPNRKTLVFLPLVSCSEKFAALCRRHGLAAEHVDGGSPDRKAILERFSSGETTLLSNAMLLTEGYDEPSIDCVVCLRPTKIRSLYSQIVGRGTRIHPGKDHLLLLDFLWLSSKHSLIKPAHLIAADDKEAQEITEALEDGDGDLEKAQEAANADRTRKLVAQLRENRTRNSSTFDAMEFALTLNDPSLAQFEPTMGWHVERVTPKQTQLLAKFGIDPMSVMTKGHAALLLDRIFMRLDLKLATAKQVRWLRKLGHPKPELASFKEASDFLNTRFTPKIAHP